jgi:hypothetical protein
LESGQTGHVDNLNLKKLFDIDNLPSGIPTEVTEASIELDSNGVVFRGTLHCSAPTKGGDAPKFRLEELSLVAGFSWSDGKSKFRVSMGLDMILYPVPIENLDPNKEAENQDPARSVWFSIKYYR